MSLEQYAKLIPAAYRKTIISQNLIFGALAYEGDAKMIYLFTVWKEYIEPGIELGCGKCLERVLKNFREMQPFLVKLESDSNLLNSA